MCHYEQNFLTRFVRFHNRNECVCVFACVFAAVGKFHSFTMEPVVLRVQTKYELHIKLIENGKALFHARLLALVRSHDAFTFSQLPI